MRVAIFLVIALALMTLAIHAFRATHHGHEDRTARLESDGLLPSGFPRRQFLLRLAGFVAVFSAVYFQKIPFAHAGICEDQREQEIAVCYDNYEFCRDQAGGSPFQEVVCSIQLSECLDAAALKYGFCKESEFQLEC